VFCSIHDDGLFKKIDQLPIDFSSKEQVFLLALKAVSFSFRKTQYLLGVDSQIEILRPFEILEVHAPPRLTIDVSRFQQQYLGFIAEYGFVHEAIRAYESRDFDFFLCLYRSIPYTKQIFYSSFLNVSHDLTGKKINNSNEVIALTCNIFTFDGRLHVLLGCPHGMSKELYKDLFMQLEKIDEETLIAALNNIITSKVETLLLPESFSPTRDDLQKIATQSLKSGDLFDLKDFNRAVKFI